MKKGFQGFCYSGLNGFYNAVTDKPVVLEKSRGWGIHYDLLQFVMGEQPKVICMVRDLKQIVASMEKKFRAAPETDSGIVNHAELRNTSTPKRVDHYLATQPLGLALERLSEIFRQGLNEKIMFVRYEDLCKSPEQTLKSIYNYFRLPNYEYHNFNSITQVTEEDDSLYGIFGDHKIQPQVKPVKNNFIEILGKEQCDRLRQHYDWYFRAFNYI
jgi:sulfotransferase